MATDLMPWLRLVETLERSGVRHIVHVGGGDGSALSLLLGRLPQATGVLFDRPDRLAAAGAVVEAAGVEDRVDVVADKGDEAVPPGGDAYLVTPDSSDPVAIESALNRCRVTMAPSALLVLSAKWSEGDLIDDGAWSVVDDGPAGAEVEP